MGAAALPLFGITSLMQFSAQRSAGKAAAAAGEASAKGEELGAIQRNADRKGRLAEALASQTASAGARGISAFEGSPLQVLEADIGKEAEATERDMFNSRMSAMTARTRGKSAQASANSGAALGLLKSGATLAALAPAGGGGASTGGTIQGNQLPNGNWSPRR